MTFNDSEECYIARKSHSIPKKSRFYTRAVPSVFIMLLAGSNVGPGSMHGLSRTTMQEVQSRDRDAKMALILLYATRTSRSGLLNPSLHPHGIATQEPCSFITQYILAWMSHSWTWGMLPTNQKLIIKSYMQLDLQGIGPYLRLEHDFHFFKQHVIIAWKDSRDTCQ